VTTETLDVAVTTPASYGDKPLPKRNGPRPLLPGSWLKRKVRLEYTVGSESRETSGQLLDFYPAGLVINIAGERTLVCWDVLAMVSLVGD
jgi:hypothetical protein